MVYINNSTGIKVFGFDHLSLWRNGSSISFLALTGHYPNRISLAKKILNNVTVGVRPIVLKKSVFAEQADLINSAIYNSLFF